MNMAEEVGDEDRRGRRDTEDSGQWREGDRISRRLRSSSPSPSSSNGKLRDAAAETSDKDIHRRRRNRSRSRSRERDRDGYHRVRVREGKIGRERDPDKDTETRRRRRREREAEQKEDWEDHSRRSSRSHRHHDIHHPPPADMDRDRSKDRGELLVHHDQNTRNIEFYDAMSVPMAIALSGQPLLGYPVMVKPSEAEKNLVQSTTIAGPDGSIGPYSGGARRLYVGNLHFNITEDQLRQVFEPFGSVELVQLLLDQDSGRCKGFGFVQFARLEDARAAQSLNEQLDIAGRTIKVSTFSDQVGMQETGVNAWGFDDDDGSGLSLNARSRTVLMQKLDRSGFASSGSDHPLATAQVLGSIPEIASLVSPVGQSQTTLSSFAGLPGSDLPIPTVTASGIDAIGVPSECLLLKNMFDHNSETKPDFELDIVEDIQDECTKFGAVKHIYMEKNSSGFVYLRFDSIQSAMNAQRALHGRWFAGKMIEAIYMIPGKYKAKFLDSK